jgi:hypothetical protein
MLGACVHRSITDLHKIIIWLKRRCTLSHGFKYHCETLVLVFRMRSYKPRCRVAVGVTSKRTLTAKVISAMHRSKFAALSPVMMTAAR